MLRSLPPNPASRMSRTPLLAAFLLVTLSSLACKSSGPPETANRPGPGGPGEAPPAEAVPVEVAETAREEMVALYSTSATLRAERRATVTTRTSGVLQTLRVEEGDRVREGQPLAELENDEQRIALARARATAETRRREFQRLEELYQQALVSEEQFEQARRDNQDAQHAVELAELELARTVINSPFSGVVLTRHLDVGNTVNQGTAVYDLADVTPLYTDVNVPERHVSLLSPGQEVQLTPDATFAPVAARIERIAPEVDRSTGTVKVTLAVDEAETLRPGTFVRVDITTDRHAEALVVPREALVAEGRRWFLFTVDGDKAKKVEVILGYEDQSRVEIHPAEGELDAGIQVVTAGAGALEDGATVRLAGASGDDTSAQNAPATASR